MCVSVRTVDKMAVQRGEIASQGSGLEFGPSGSLKLSKRQHTHLAVRARLKQVDDTNGGAPDAVCSRPKG
jgi:hypothetical protein